MSTMTLVMIGPHAAGKTTLGRALAAQLGVPFDDELGARLRSEAQEQDPAAHALRQQQLFDQTVQRQELARDRQTVGPRVVETWHPGNAAYALERNGEAFDTEAAREAAQQAPGVLVLPVLARVETVRVRCSEYGADPDEMARFFVRVAERALSLARSWRLPVAQPVWTDHCDVPSALQALLQRW